MDQAKYCFALTQEKIYDFLWLGLVTRLPQNLAFATRLFKQDSLKKLSFKRVSLASLKLQCNFFTALISGLKRAFVASSKIETNYRVFLKPLVANIQVNFGSLCYNRLNNKSAANL
ncbi:hypothetical protein PSYCG_00230 [Psychrobacter sp. G]|nr:hypothetical protein PSYCG_00230 [Psychrobacter sp. G]